MKPFKYLHEEACRFVQIRVLVHIRKSNNHTPQTPHGAGGWCSCRGKEVDQE
jgi:hypothetical protein